MSAQRNQKENELDRHLPSTEPRTGDASQIRERISIRPITARIKPDASPDNSSIRLILLGKTGAGKSTLGNFLLGNQPGKNTFEPGSGALAETTICQKSNANYDQYKVTVVDTPGLLDTRCKTNEDKKKFAKEIAKSLQASSPGPHLFLIVMEFTKMTDQEYEAIDQMKKIFPEFMDHSLFVFIQKGRKPTDVEKYVNCSGSDREDAKKFKALIKECKYGYIDANTEEEEQGTRAILRERIMNRIIEIVKAKNHQHYSVELVQKVAAVVKTYKTAREATGNHRMFDAEKAEKTIADDQYHAGTPTVMIIGDDAVFPEVQEIVETHLASVLRT